MKNLFELLFGRNQDVRIVILIMLPSFAFFAFILGSYALSINTVSTAILALDIVAGLLSNLQPKTNQAWQEQTKLARAIFIIVHVTIYPLLIIVFEVSIPLMMLMLVMLLSKTLAFINGSFKN